MYQAMSLDTTPESKLVIQIYSPLTGESWKDRHITIDPTDHLGQADGTAKAQTDTAKAV